LVYLFLIIWTVDFWLHACYFYFVSGYSQLWTEHGEHIWKVSSDFSGVSWIW